MTEQYFLATKTLVALRWLYFAHIKNQHENTYAFDFMAYRGLANFLVRYCTARHDQFIAAFSDK